MTKKTLLGQLLVANPLNPKDGLDHSVILVVTDSPTAVLGLQLNLPAKNMPVSGIFAQLGLWYDGDEVVHQGGPLNPSKIHMVHTLDWQGLTTVEIAPNLGLTNDISILAALARGEGPEYFRACSGFLSWRGSVLDEELDYKSKTEHKWELAPSNISTVFETDELDQWHRCVEASAKSQVSRWFNLFQG